MSKTTCGWDIRDLDGLQREIDDHNPHIVVIDSKAAMGHLLEDISKLTFGITWTLFTTSFSDQPPAAGFITPTRTEPSPITRLSKRRRTWFTCSARTTTTSSEAHQMPQCKGIRTQYVFDGDFLTSPCGTQPKWTWVKCFLMCSLHPPAEQSGHQARDQHCLRWPCP